MKIDREHWRQELRARKWMNRGFEMRRAAFVDTQRRVLEDARLSPYSCTVTETILNSGSDDCKKPNLNAPTALVYEEYERGYRAWWRRIMFIGGGW